MFGAIGKAMKAPLRPINRAVGAVPGINKLPGNQMGQKMGIAPQQGAGIGPSPNAMQNVGMLAGKMGGIARPQPAMGANYGTPTPTPLSSPPPPIDTGFQAPNQLSDQPSPSDMERIGQVGADMGIARPDVMPQSPGNEAPINQGVGPQPQAMNRMMGRRPMNPRMMRGQM